MKTFTLTLALMLAYAFASFGQENPCPDIQAHGFTDITTVGSNCTTSLYAYATGDISSQKGLNMKVYKNSVAPANLVMDVCHIVPLNSPSTLYSTPQFTVPCSVPLVYVLTRTTASNGNCQGGTCGVTVTINAAPLPVKITSFYASRNNSTVSLSWKTAEEINAKEFIVERKTDKGFVAIATIKASNRELGDSYSYTDKNEFKGISQYRLMMVDMDGKSKYSEIRSVKAASTVSDFTVFPNPSFGYTKITVTETNDNTDVQLVDNAGRIVKTVSMSNKSSVELNGLQKGIYMVRIINKTNGDFVTKKLTVVN